MENSEWSLSRFLACSGLPCSTNLVTASQYSACCSGSSLAWLRTDLALEAGPVEEVGQHEAAGRGVQVEDLHQVPDQLQLVQQLGLAQVVRGLNLDFLHP